MRRVIRLVPLVSLCLACVGVAITASAAQKLPMVRVATDTASVRARPGAKSEVVKSVARGDLLEAVDREDDWFWVVLPPDESGTRMPGWIQARDVVVVSMGEPGTVLNHFTEAMAAAKERERAQAAREKADEEAKQAKAQARQQAMEAKAQARQQALEAQERARRATAQAKQAKAQARAAKEKAREAARLERARQRVEQARREYEAAQKSAAAGQPAAPPSPKTQKREQPDK